jgi:probable F420-dependent oxidoreductase
VIHVGVTGYPDVRHVVVADLARWAEERGFESLFVPEHTNIPTSRETRWPGARPGAEELPDFYWHFPDPFVALGAAAAVTSRIRLGTGVCLVAQRDPILLAKEVATLDGIAGPDRLVLGVGMGWNVEEMRNHGVDPATRWERTRETVEALRVLWTDAEAGYEGRHVRIEPTRVFPRPSRPPPVLLGGGLGPRLVGHVAAWADGWMPISGRGSLRERLDSVRDACDAAGRDPDTLSVTVMGAAQQPDAVGNLEAEGVDRVVLTVEHAELDDPRRILDRWAADLAPFLDA